MNRLIKQLLFALIIPLSVGVARADMVIFDVTGDTRNMVMSLGTRLDIGCAILAAGMVLAAVIVRKKC